MAGEVAPDFTATVWDGSSVKLSELRGSKIWVAFFRYAGCPLCNLRMHDIDKRWAKEYQGRLKILAVFQSPRESIAEFMTEQPAPFPIIADPDQALYRLYGVEEGWWGLLSLRLMADIFRAWRQSIRHGKSEGSETRIPADFLIDEDGIIRTAFYGKDIGDHIPFDVIADFVR